MTQSSGTEEAEPLPEDYLERVRSMLEFLVRQGDADIDSLAAIIGTSRRSLQRHLLRRGETFARMLEDSSVKVIDVAYEVGYTDPSHFARAFRRWTGVAPSIYRRVGASVG